VGQVAPIQIILFDQTNFPVALPILQLFLTCDCFLRRCENFHVNETMYTVFLDEFRAMIASMLLKPLPQVMGDADVKRTVSAAGENVDAICACSAHGLARLRKNSDIGGWVPAFAGTTVLPASEQIKNTLASL
jgi:hypothetical protein